VTVPLGPLETNGYLLIEGDDVVVVDPGGEGEELAAALAARGWVLKAVWLTHAHFDHVGGIAGLLRAAGTVPIHMHPADEQLLRNAAEAGARWGMVVEAPPTEYVALTHGETLTSGSVSARVLHTPGHAPGHVAFYLEDVATVLSGDALFKGSIGRTDLPYGDHEQLLESIRRELLSLPQETRVLPGHGEPTTVAAETENNPFL